jgi:hypothetical protein
VSTTTPNFNFPIPQSTDLVKDGATAIASLGTAIDTDFVDLKGGTTGQVLAKASNTDMDFSWVAQDDSNAIQNTIVDAKGDLIAASAADTPARLAVGNNGETLVADSSTSTGLRYTAGTVQGNPVLNSAFQIFQRGTSTAGSTTAFGADRWQAYRGTTGSTYSRQITNDTTNLPSIQYCLRVQRDSGNSATNQIILGQNFETVNSIPYAGKTVTFSFYARAGANYSPTSSALPAYIYTGTGTDQNGISSVYTGNAASLSGTATLTTTWQRFTFTGTLPTTMTEMSIQFPMNPIGTAGANDYYEITGVQIDIGSVALPFRTYAGTLQGELAACQRYCQVFNATNWRGFTGQAISTSRVFAPITLPVQMRTSPTVTFSAAGDFNNNDATGNGRAVTTATTEQSRAANIMLDMTSSSAGLVAGNAVNVTNANSNSVITISAEL